MKSELGPFVYRSVPAVVLRRIGGYSLSLIEYIWKYVSLTRERRTKVGSFPFAYREVPAFALEVSAAIRHYSLNIYESTYC